MGEDHHPRHGAFTRPPRGGSRSRPVPQAAGGKTRHTGSGAETDREGPARAGACARCRLQCARWRLNAGRRCCFLRAGRPGRSCPCPMCAEAAGGAEVVDQVYLSARADAAGGYRVTGFSADGARFLDLAATRTGPFLRRPARQAGRRTFRQATGPLCARARPCTGRHRPQAERACRSPFLRSRRVQPQRAAALCHPPSPTPPRRETRFPRSPPRCWPPPGPCCPCSKPAGLWTRLHCVRR